MDTGKCIFRNLLVFVILLCIGVSSVTFSEKARDTLSTRTSFYVSLFAFILFFVLMLFARSSVSHLFRSAAVIAFGLSTIFMLIVSASLTDDPASVLLALIFSVIFFSVMALRGIQDPLSATTLKNWFVPMIVALVVIIILMFSNLFLGLNWLDVGISICIVVLFAAWTLYDVSYFVYKCQGPNCCLDGTVNLWLDLANMFTGTSMIF